MPLIYDLQFGFFLHSRWQMRRMIMFCWVWSLACIWELLFILGLVISSAVIRWASAIAWCNVKFILKCMSDLIVLLSVACLFYDLMIVAQTSAASVRTKGFSWFTFLSALAWPRWPWTVIVKLDVCVVRGRWVNSEFIVWHVCHRVVEHVASKHLPATHGQIVRLLLAEQGGGWDG